MAQLHIGPKAGFQAFSPIYKEAVKSDSISSRPLLGLNAGFALDYNINKHFSCYSELIYSLKGKSLAGGIRDKFRNRAYYHYVELPVLLRYTMNTYIRGRTFTWYLNGGGTFNYWFYGNGVIKSWELNESAIDKVNYFIKYHPKNDNALDQRFNVYLAEPTRVQVGLVFGLGYVFEMAQRSQLTTELRYCFRQSWLARDSQVDMGLAEYMEDFRTMEHTLSLNVAYLFEYNLGEFRKGKSTGGKIIRTKRVGQGPSSPKKINENKLLKRH